MVRKAAVAQTARPKSELVIHDVAQGSDEWFQLRLGLPTASHFGALMAEGKDGGPSLTRRDYMYRLAGEQITGLLAEETFKSRAMERGKEMEPQAIADYEARKLVLVQRIGLAINFSGLKRCGASPDGIVGFDGGLETKTTRPDLMISLLDKPASMPATHRPQVQGNMLVLERDWWDLKIFYPKMPDFTVRVYRDNKYITELHNAIEVFNFDLRNLVDKLRKMGAT